MATLNLQGVLDRLAAFEANTQSDAGRRVSTVLGQGLSAAQRAAARANIGAAARDEVVLRRGRQTVFGDVTFERPVGVPAGSIPQDRVTDLVTDLASKLDAADIAGKADDNAVVKLTGDQTIAGAKTFSTAPTVPDGSFTPSKVAGLLDAAYNVKVNGTVLGDGVTDDTAAFHAARDAVGSSGRRVFVPPGTYIVNALTLSVSSQVWELAPGAVIKQKAGTDSALGTVIISGNNVTLRGGKIDGNWANATYAFRLCVHITGDNVTVSGVECTQGMAGGIQLSSTAEGGLIFGCYSHHHGSGLQSGGGAGDAPNGLILAGSARHRVIGNRFEYCGTPGNEALYDGNGIYLAGGATGGHNLILGNQCSYNARRGIKVQNAGNSIIGNTLVLNSCGLGITASAIPTNVPTLVSGNLIKDSTLQGLQMDYCSFVTITGNAIIDSGSHGLGAAVNANHVTFVGNQIVRSGGNAMNIATGLKGWTIADNQVYDCNDGIIITAATDFGINGNTVANTDGGTNTYGIRLIGANDRINLVGNRVGLGVTTAYSIAGTNITRSANTPDSWDAQSTANSVYRLPWNGTDWTYNGVAVGATRPTARTDVYLDLYGAPAATPDPAWMLANDSRTDV